MQNLKAACLATAGLATAWGATPALAVPTNSNYVLTTNLNQSLSNAYFFLFTSNGSSANTPTVSAIGSIPAGANHKIQVSASSGGATVTGYSFAGEYDVPNGFVTLSLTSSSASTATSGSQAFTTTFGSTTSEATFASYLSGANLSGMAGFELSNINKLSAPLGSTGGEAVNFSNATDAGATSAAAGTLPEPTALTSVGAGLFVLLRRRRRSTTA